MSYTIIKAVDPDHSNAIHVQFDDGVDQWLAGMPVGDAAALDAALVAYEAAYLAGKELEAAPVADPAVLALEGKRQDTAAALAALAAADAVDTP